MIYKARMEPVVSASKCLYIFGLSVIEWRWRSLECGILLLMRIIVDVRSGPTLRGAATIRLGISATSVRLMSHDEVVGLKCSR